MEQNCPFCRRVISTEDNYCPYCGYFIKKSEKQEKITEKLEQTSTSTKTTQKPVPIIEEEPKKSELKELKMEKPEEEIQTNEVEPDIKIPKEIIDQYYIRIKTKQYDEKLKEYKEKINHFLSELNDEELEEIKDQIPKLKESIDKLREKRNNLLSQKHPIPQEQLLDKRIKLKKQISNLKNKFHLKEIEPHVYEELKAEYQNKLNELNKKIEFPNNWQKILKKDIKQQEEELDILEGRFKVGELSKTEYEEEKLNINKLIEKLNLVLSELKL